MPDSEQVLEKLIDRAGELYTLPAVAVEVLQLTDDPGVDARKLKDCIENDPALVGKILRVVNSSLFGLSREISDLNQAIALLGTKPLKLLVLGFNLPDAFFANIAGDELGRYWRNTLTKAVAAREISQQIWNVPGDDAFISGLLQDLGMLVLLQSIGQPYVCFLERARAEGGDLCELERAAIGLDHTQLTSGLLGRWGLPQLLAEAVSVSRGRESHELNSPAAELSAILRLAELLTRFLAERESDVLPEFMQQAARYRDVSVDQIGDLVMCMQEKVEQLADVLSLELPFGLDFADLLEQSHQQLVVAASEAAVDLVRHRERRDAQRRSGFAEGQEAIELSNAVADWCADDRSTATAEAEVTETRNSADDPAYSVSAESQTRRPTPSDPAPKKGAMPDSAASIAAREELAASANNEAEIAIAEDDPALLGRLAVAVAACRQARCPVSLLLVEIDRFADSHFALGPDAPPMLWQMVQSACQQIDHPNKTCIAVREARFAVILVDCDRQHAARLGNQLVRSIRDRKVSAEEGDRSLVTVSAGAASVTLLPKNFPPQALIEAADRCLYGAQASGGDGLKTIEIY